MGDSLGRQLLDLLLDTLVQALTDVVNERAAELTALAADPRFAGTPFEGCVLQPADPGHPALKALSMLTAEEDGTAIGLHGWRSTADAAAPVGVALVASSGGRIAALSFVPHEGLAVRAHGLDGAAVASVTTSIGATLTVNGTTPGEVHIAFPRGQAPEIKKLAAGSRIDVGLSRPAGQPLGPATGPNVQLGTIEGTAFVAITDEAGGLDKGMRLRLSKGDVRLIPDFLAGILPLDLQFPLDLDLAATPDGVVLRGSPSLKIRVTGAAGKWLDLALDLAEGQAVPVLDLSFRTSLKVALPGVPITVRVDGLGANLPLTLKLGEPFLVDLSGVGLVAPDGAEVTIDLPAVAGSGGLIRVDQALAGGLSVRIPPLSASAFGVLRPPHDGEPLSFLVLMGATFPPPGVQVGFGFAITGVGGILGVNSRVDRDALLRAVSDGTAAQLLFPTDPTSAGRSTLEALPAIFPAARGSVVVGPMFQISWGGRMVSLSVAVLLEAAGQVRFTILGKLVVAVPDPAAPLVLLQATFAGLVEPAVPSLLFVASLNGSHIVGYPLTGDLLLLVRGGSDATLVLSAGGFHPAFPVPRGVPALRRLAMDICPVAWLAMRCENYFALTSNTLQLGARLELSAEVAGCGLRGFLSFDALAQFSPFHFQADMAGGISLRVFGETLMGVALALHLEGPAPYLARGTGSVDLFLFEASFDFEIGWGAPAAEIAAPDVGADLKAALGKPAAWRSRAAVPVGVTLTEVARKALENALVVDPWGTVSVLQQVVPLGLEINRYGGKRCPKQRWDLVGGAFGQGEPADRTNELRADFAPGLYLESGTDDAALSKAPFLPLRAGLELHPATADGSELRDTDLAWDEHVIANDDPVPSPASCGLIVDVGLLEVIIAASTVGDASWWPAPVDTVVVEATPPAVVASTWSMTPRDLTAASEFEAAAWVTGADPTVMAVETWEI